jgi:pyridoxine kinase
MARVLAISSQVARGAVGLSATVPALQGLGHEVWSVPTVLLANRPGLGDLARHAISADDLATTLEALCAGRTWSEIDAVLTGYFPSADSVAIAAGAITKIKAGRARCIYLCDPILGDSARLYVGTPVAAAIRDFLLPLADVTTPNLFELSWLSGQNLSGICDAARIARSLGPGMVAVTSAEHTAGAVTTLLSAPPVEIVRRSAFCHEVPNGTGDLFAGLFLGNLLNRGDAALALDASLARLDQIVVKSAGQLELRLAALFEG